MLPAKTVQYLVGAPGYEILTQKPRRSCLKFSLSAALLLFFQLSDAQVDTGDVVSFMKKNEKVLGKNVAVAVYKDGKVVFQKGSNEFFNAKSPAAVPGASKWFTAALVMAFVDEGKIKLDDPISKYLPAIWLIKKTLTSSMRTTT